MGPDRRLDQYAARQYGVFSLAQAHEAGLTGRMVERRVASGAWIRMASGVYALASAPPRWERQLAAAVLSRPGSVVAGRSAAHLHGLAGFSKGRPVIMLAAKGNARSPIARVIRSKYFEDVSRARVRGFPTTSVTETMVTLAGELPPSRLEAVLDDGLASEQFDAEDLMAVLEMRAGSRGLPVLRRLTEERLPDAYQPPTSELERLLYDLLAHPGVPPVSRQFPFSFESAPMTVDAYVPLWRLIVEADGRRWHTRKADFERDRARDNAATAVGLAVLRFTYRMLTRDFATCQETVLRTGRTRVA